MRRWRLCERVKEMQRYNVWNATRGQWAGYTAESGEGALAYFRAQVALKNAERISPGQVHFRYEVRTWPECLPVGHEYVVAAVYCEKCMKHADTLGDLKNKMDLAVRENDELLLENAKLRRRIEHLERGGGGRR